MFEQRGFDIRTVRAVTGGDLARLDLCDARRKLDALSEMSGSEALQGVATLFKRAKNITEDQVDDHVFGYTNLNDVSARDFQMATTQWVIGKTFDTFAPFGPAIVTKDEIPNPQNLQIKLWNNGVLRQNYNTNDMAHKIPRCVEFVSACHTLEPGDVLPTGTNHRGLHSFMDGDKVELTIEKVGTLKFNVKDEHKRKWARTTRSQHKDKGGEGPHTPQLSGKYAK